MLDDIKSLTTLFNDLRYTAYIYKHVRQQSQERYGTQFKLFKIMEIPTLQY